MVLTLVALESCSCYAASDNVNLDRKKKKKSDVIRERLSISGCS